MPDLKSTIKDTASKLIAVLATRNRDIIARRFGLKTGKKETLESIGENYGITRERVRQIEEASIKQLKGELISNNSVKIKPFVALAENILEQAGGVLGEQDFFASFFNSGMENRSNINEPANAALVFLLSLDGKLGRHNDDEKFANFWSLSNQHTDSLKNSVSLLVKGLNKNESPVIETAWVDFSKKIGITGKQLNPAVLATYMTISREISKNIFGQVGLTSWPEIKPRGVRDKSYLVLKKSGKPKHFREITQLINETFSNLSDQTARKANVQTVHNELIKDPRFVLVGRGMYGLSEWGYKSGTVKDVLVDLLRSASKPVKRDELITQVLSNRMVKENTIILNLQNARVFKKTDEGYTLQA